MHLQGQLNRITIALAVFLLFISLISNFEAEASHNPNLYVSAENPTFGNMFSGSMVVEVVINDPGISDTDEGKGEPDVTINGKQLRMVQVSNGQWHAYFANVNKAKIADSTVTLSGKGLDFGVFCSRDTTIFGVDFSDTDGFSFPGDSGITGTDGTASFQQCTGTPTSSLFENNVVRQPHTINTNSNVPTGQIGLTESAWPIVQLFSFNNDVEIQYNPGGGIQKVELEYDNVENISLNLDRENYPTNSEVFVIVSDIQLNQDPTSRDSWTFKVTSPLATFYQAYNENGNDSANNSPGLVNLFPNLSSLDFDDNGKISVTLGDVAKLKTNDRQQDLSVTDNTTIFSDIITLVESQPNSGIFESFDDGDTSVIGIKSDAPRGKSASISYNSKSYSILSGSSTASVSIDSQSSSFKAGTKQSVTVVDPDQNINSGTRDHLDVFRSSAIIPTLQIGLPLTLEKSSNVQFYPLSTSSLVSDGIDIPSSVPDSNSDRLILDTKPPVSNASFEKISINLGFSAEQLESLLIDVDDPSSDGTNWINYDLRSLQQQLSVNNFADTSISLHFGLSDSSPIIIVDAGDISNPQGLVQLDDDDIDDISLKSGTAFLVINFGSSNGGTISLETNTQPIVIDFFSFGLIADQITNNAIYRFELEETSASSGTFSGTMEYTVTNQLNFFSPSLIKSLRIISDEIRFLVSERLIDEKGIAIKYSDLATVGTKIDVSTKSDIKTNSGTVGFSTQSLRFGHPVGIVLKDPDLNLDKNTIESYSVVDDPNSPNVDTVGDSSGNPLLEVMIKGVRYKRCTINGVEHGGLASTSFTLTETSPSSGIFEGVFRVPIRICNESGTALISPAGGSIELKYFDFRDSFGNPNTFTTGRISSSSTQTTALSLNAERFVLPKYKETIDVIVSGKIDNYKQGTVIKLILEIPDKSSQSFNLYATSQGNFKGVLTLNHDSIPGTYNIFVEYLGSLQDNTSFSIVRHIVPDWIKNNASWWSTDAITDDEFIGGIEHLIKEKIIIIPESQSSIKSEKIVPQWIKNTANWWSEDLITDDEFVSALEFLVKAGIIRV